MAVDVSTALPQLDLKENTLITVTLDDPGAVITKFTLHGWQESGAAVTTLSPVTGAYTEGEAV